MRKIVATHVKTTRLQAEGGLWVNQQESRIVEVMAIAQGYAMVRLKGCAPYIADFTDLKDIK